MCVHVRVRRCWGSNSGSLAWQQVPPFAELPRQPRSFFTDILFVTLKSSLTSAIYCSKFFEWVHHKSLPPKIQVCACANVCVCMHAYMQTCTCVCRCPQRPEVQSPSKQLQVAVIMCMGRGLSRAVSTLNRWGVSAVLPSLPHQPNSWLCSLVSWWNGVLSNSLPVKAKWFYSLALSYYYNFHTTFKVIGRLRKSHWDSTWFF